MLNICVWYIWYNQYNPDWVNTFTPGMNLATSRLSVYTDTLWSYEFVESFQTSYPISGHLDVNKAIAAVIELANSDSTFKTKYDSCDIPLFIFSNSKDAFSVDYRSPIYGSDQMMELESAEMTLIEHEIGHTFGLPDHMKPFSNPAYESCIMGNLYLGEIRFCPECQLKFVRSNYNKSSYEELIGESSPTPPPTPPIEIYTEWVGSYGRWDTGKSDDLLDLILHWPAETEVIATWKLKNSSPSEAITASIEFLDTVSGTITIAAGKIGELTLIIPALAEGTHYTFFIGTISGNPVTEPIVAVNVVPKWAVPVPSSLPKCLLIATGAVATIAIILRRKGK